MTAEVSRRVTLAWVAAVAIYVGLEKMVARSPWLSSAVGAGLIVAGGIILARGLAAAA